jgi:hypothetical protein
VQLKFAREMAEIENVENGAQKEEDLKLTQLILEGKNPRGIPSAKFIVCDLITLLHLTPLLLRRKMLKNILTGILLNLHLVHYKISMENTSTWSKVSKNQKGFINLKFL